jgi:hypothetical protein
MLTITPIFQLKLQNDTKNIKDIIHCDYQTDPTNYVTTLFKLQLIYLSIQPSTKIQTTNIYSFSV